ncbi:MULTISPECIES: F0F1 ATP synthase subunit delta [Clostridium]|uniref:ATP synthase subunit delta n=1 Tax=Clostridium saccharoperbutylacetonicum N1-4(HMT) TaxID=931276 RepID=M1LNK9_9CLOT|nr:MULTISPECIES: F0F1 ATP synthase subunit delta [Clostridium]AGF54415.1 ATP synthase subunit delta [Clostridium saccharoperbutylacetonicum N1-4(HMT)]AQR93330.1 ATP synthase subunit delta, sodium ion specific [Clostridium saccharoperbutylacetonicum]NRT59066.1 F-type H+-transporting ATPase subunit delta [Clostridium saccharoperbutylacetonicum]NSB28254.1 F-type H+-transporting ATPase subunit delta [Clostridium saccharoperbutylacetonicum]NSB34747.1 F-type H+-transporting ATPase subunit delta [Clo
MYEYLDRRYALALYEIAEKNNKVDEYLQDLRDICDLFDSNEDFYQVIKHPKVNTAKKKQLFNDLFKGKIDEELLAFLIVLIEKGRVLYLREKLNQMVDIDLERRNTIRGVVKTAVPLLDEELEQLKNIFEKKYDKTILFDTKIDKSLLGGVYVKVGNDIIDGTIKSKIEEMKELMLKKE